MFIWVVDRTSRTVFCRVRLLEVLLLQELGHLWFGGSCKEPILASCRHLLHVPTIWKIVLVAISTINLESELPYLASKFSLVGECLELVWVLLGLTESLWRAAELSRSSPDTVSSSGSSFGFLQNILVLEKAFIETLELLCRNWIFSIQQLYHISFFQSNLVGTASYVLLPSYKDFPRHLKTPPSYFLENFPLATCRLFANGA